WENGSARGLRPLQHSKRVSDGFHFLPERYYNEGASATPALASAGMSWECGWASADSTSAGQSTPGGCAARAGALRSPGAWGDPRYGPAWPLVREGGAMTMPEDANDAADQSTPPLYRRLLADTTPLRVSAAYRRLWTGQALSDIGGRMTGVAVPIQIYALTHSSLAVGLAGLAIAVPLIGLGLVGGSIADAFDRRVLVIGTTALLAVVSLPFALQALLDLRQLWPLYALVAAQSG